MNIEISSGVQTLINRMESHPEEFFDEAPKWRFMYAERFRDTMTESEKGAIHAALREVRRKEFAHKVMRTLLEDDLNKQSGAIAGQYRLATSTGTYTEAMRLDSNGNLGVGIKGAISTGLQIGKETLTEDDLRAIKQTSISIDKFK